MHKQQASLFVAYKGQLFFLQIIVKKKIKIISIQYILNQH